MPRGVALAEHAEVEVPRLALEHVDGEPALGLEAGQQPVGQLPVLVRRPDQALPRVLVIGCEVTLAMGVDPEHRMQAMRSDELIGDSGR
jgi:hypothetical protein